MRLCWLSYGGCKPYFVFTNIRCTLFCECQGFRGFFCTPPAWERLYPTTTLVKSPNIGRVLGSMVASTREPKTNRRATASIIRASDKRLMSFFIVVHRNIPNRPIHEIAVSWWRNCNGCRGVDGESVYTISPLPRLCVPPSYSSFKPRLRIWLFPTQIGCKKAEILRVVLDEWRAREIALYLHVQRAITRSTLRWCSVLAKVFLGAGAFPQAVVFYLR